MKSSLSLFLDVVLALRFFDNEFLCEAHLDGSVNQGSVLRKHLLFRT
jgi:hypothetical protein